MSAMHEISRKGLLQKKGKDGKWKQKYCEINGNFLNVYGNQSQAELQSVIDLSQVDDIITGQQSRNSDTINRGPASGYNIRIEFSQKGSKPLILKSLTLEDAVEWVDVLRKVKEKTAPKSSRKIADIISTQSQYMNNQSLPSPDLSYLCTEKESDNIADENSSGITEMSTPPSPDNDKPVIIDATKITPITTQQTQVPLPSHEVVPSVPKPKEKRVSKDEEYMEPWPIILILAVIIIGSICVYFYYADEFAHDQRQYVQAAEVIVEETIDCSEESTTANQTSSPYNSLQPTAEPRMSTQLTLSPPTDHSSHTRKVHEIIIKLFSPVIFARNLLRKLFGKMHTILAKTWKKVLGRSSKR